jgi:hypothetical protein
MLTYNIFITFCATCPSYLILLDFNTNFITQFCVPSCPTHTQKSFKRCTLDKFATAGHIKGTVSCSLMLIHWGNMLALGRDKREMEAARRTAPPFTVSARTSWLASPRADGSAGHDVTNTLTHTHTHTHTQHYGGRVGFTLCLLIKQITFLFYCNSLRSLLE